MGFLIGQSDLSHGFPWSMLSTPGGAPSESQLRSVGALTVAILLSTHLVSMWAAVEVPLRERADSEKGWKSIGKGMLELKEAATTLPEPIKALFSVQCEWPVCARRSQCHGS